MKSFLLIVVAFLGLAVPPAMAGNSEVAHVANALRPAGDEAVEAFWLYWGDPGLRPEVFNALEKLSGKPLINEDVDGVSLAVSWAGMEKGFTFIVGDDAVEDVKTELRDGRAWFSAVHDEEGRPVYAGYVGLIRGEIALTINSAYGEPARWTLDPNASGDTAAAASAKKCRCFGSGNARTCTDQECDDMTVECGTDSNAHRYCRWVVPPPFHQSFEVVPDDAPAPF